MRVLLLALLGWVLVSVGLGALWMWGHRPRPEVLVADLPLPRVEREHARAG